MRDLNDFRTPHRGPWLLLVVLAVVGIFLLYQSRAKRGAEREPEEPVVAVPDAGDEMILMELPDDEPETTIAEPVEPPPERPIEGLDVTEVLARARRLEKDGDLVRARALYRAAARGAASAASQKEARDAISRLSLEMAFSPAMTPDKVEYVVKSGDSVERIARRLGSTIDLVQRSNQIANVNRIRVGDRLRVLTGDVKLVISKSACRLDMYLDDKFFARFYVGIGKHGKTPEGTFVINDRIKEPVWWRPDGREIPYGDPANILGTRWMAMKATGDTPNYRGYGIHGTWDDSSIGKAESQGCIRMRNADVEQLYALVPLGAQVVITK